MPTLVWNLRATRTDPDAELVRGMAAGDEQALLMLYERHASSILAYLAHRVRDRQLAEELLHDVMLAAWQASAAFRGESSVRTWLFTIAHNRAVNAFRRGPSAGGNVDLGTAGMIPDPAAGAAEGVDLRAAIERLPAQQQAALDLVFFHGFSASEVATVMAVAPSTVRSWISRARAALRESLSPQGGSHV
jgi:RNA polymerase sigma-70 factor, ECF subfamily